MRGSDGRVAWKQRLEVSFFKPKYMSVSDQSFPMGGIQAKVKVLCLKPKYIRQGFVCFHGCVAWNQKLQVPHFQI